MRRGFKLLIAFFMGVVAVALIFPALFAKKESADAYICGEPPDEVTFYCKVGTGPPRTDCSAPQTGEFDNVDVIGC